MNTALSTWQLVIMTVVPVATLVAWIVTIFHVAREPVQTAAATVIPVGPAAGPATAQEHETIPGVTEPVAA